MNTPMPRTQYRSRAMRQLSDSFKNASFLMCGTACTLFIFNHLLYRFSPYEELPLIPGFGYTLGLCWAALFIWAGMLLRRRWPSLRCWIQLPVLALALFCLYKYRQDVWITYRSLPYLYLSVFGTGFLVPPEAVDHEEKKSGWLDLVLLLVSAFCYTAVAVVQGRFQTTSPFMPQYKDMERLLVWLMNTTMPLVLFIAMYFAVRFSFSREGQWLGGQKWYKVISCVSFVIAFLACLFRYWFLWTDLLRFLVQPTTIYLLVVFRRATLKLFRKGPQEYPTWKDILKI